MERNADNCPEHLCVADHGKRFVAKGRISGESAQEAYEEKEAKVWPDELP